MCRAEVPELLRAPGRRARVRQPRVLRAPPRDAVLPGRRADPGRLRPRSSRRPCVQLLEALHLVCIRAVTVRPGGLQDGREALDARVREEDRELLPSWPLADVRVAVAVRPELGGRVVDVEAAEAVEPDPLVELRRASSRGRPVGDVDARDPEVAGVEAEPQRADGGRAASTRSRELVDRAADRPARAGGVLDQEPGWVSAAPSASVEARGRPARGRPRTRRRGVSRRGGRRRRPRSRRRRRPCPGARARDFSWTSCSGLRG